MIEVKYKNIRLVICQTTVRDDLNAQKIRLKLDATYSSDDGIGYWQLFSNLCASTQSVTGLPFDPGILPTADIGEVARAFEAFMDMPKTFKDRWRDGYERANADTDEDLGPTPLPPGTDPNG